MKHKGGKKIGCMYHFDTQIQHSELLASMDTSAEVEQLIMSAKKGVSY